MEEHGATKRINSLRSISAPFCLQQQLAGWLAGWFVGLAKERAPKRTLSRMRARPFAPLNLTMLTTLFHHYSSFTDTLLSNKWNVAILVVAIILHYTQHAANKQRIGEKKRTGHLSIVSIVSIVPMISIVSLLRLMPSDVDKQTPLSLWFNTHRKPRSLLAMVPFIWYPHKHAHAHIHSKTDTDKRTPKQISTATTMAGIIRPQLVRHLFFNWWDANFIIKLTTRRRHLLSITPFIHELGYFLRRCSTWPWRSCVNTLTGSEFCIYCCYQWKCHSDWKLQDPVSLLLRDFSHLPTHISHLPRTLFLPFQPF